MNNSKKFVFILIVVFMGVTIKSYAQADENIHEYIQVPGLIDVRTDFSDGVHTLEYLIKLAKKRGIDVLFINDHDRKVLEYGIRPFQNIIKKRVAEPSINKGRPENYLNMIDAASKKYPDSILIPGAESAPFYYWRGSYFKKNLTVCDWERHLLIVGLEEPKDYKELPILHNGYSTKYVLSSIISVGFFLSFVLLIIGLYMLKWKGIIRYSGITISVFALLLLINNHPFKSSPYDQYHGPQEISPYQLLIDYVNSRGGMVFWNHPETKSGKGKLGPIFRDTPPYPQVLKESKNYSGFAALYGDYITITEPGNIWDKVLIEYCSGHRENPVWGISSADFHREGGAGDKLGNYPTFFLVKSKTKKDILDALKKGRMYAYRGDADSPRMILEDFSISNSKSSQKAVMGEEIFSEGYPSINIRISTTDSEKGNSITVRLIRSGNLLETFSAETPLSINLEDDFFEPGKKVYYRLDAMDKKGRKLVSNPIFVQFQP
ncbi:MAG TPA: hypothetical protein ENH65_14265 [Candidatus Aminicenantes bacterium]|nr:hypothetical protein [Candidatus Aminicenantes bacterium]HEB34889.1 hypothetical protein [Candidatus Aminicenantes bacterium]